MSKEFKVSSYQVFARRAELNGGTAYEIRLALVDSSATEKIPSVRGVIYFQDGTRRADAYVAQDSDREVVINAYRAQADYASYLDLLRNEGPVWAMYMNAGYLRLRTGDEPIGDGES